MVLKPHFHEFEKLPEVDPMAMLPWPSDMLRALFYGVLALLGVGAGPTGSGSVSASWRACG